MFERSVSSLIRGLRSHKGKDEIKFLSTVFEEIRNEVRSGDMEIKAEAILKLTYLQMLGFASSSSSFHIVEVMAAPKYHLKHIGYLAAAQCFTRDTEVLILATNMIKKDLHSTQPLDIAAALNGLAHIMTTELAQHLARDVIGLLTHSKALIRKKALLTLYFVVIKYPEGLDLAWHRLRERLSDEDIGVVNAAVNIVCELASQDAARFVPLSPQLFDLLTTSTNNWMLIKLVKLFGILTPQEPRLVRRLLPPITTLISTTPAMSLLYECILTVIVGGMLNGPTGIELASTCVEKLGHFLDDEDQNLKYIALVALEAIVRSYPSLVARYQRIVVACIRDIDLSLKMRALELISGMADKENLPSLIEDLLSYIEAGPSTSTSSAIESLRANQSQVQLKSQVELSQFQTFTREAALQILLLGREGSYSRITDFEWYLTILVRLAYSCGEVIPEVTWQIMDLTSRIKAIRPTATQLMRKVVHDATLWTQPDSNTTQILDSAAWVCGEYCNEVDSPEQIALDLLAAAVLARHATTATLCLHSSLKLLACWTSSMVGTWNVTSKHLALAVLLRFEEHLLPFEGHPDVEVNQRTTEFFHLLELLKGDLERQPTEAPALPVSSSPVDLHSPSPSLASAPRSLHLLSVLFSAYPLGPVAPLAQSKVPAPGVLLSEWIGDQTLWRQWRNHDVRLESDRSSTAIQTGSFTREDPFDDDIDAIPIVQLDLTGQPEDVNATQTGSGSEKELSFAAATILPQARLTARRDLAPVVREEEEMPEEEMPKRVVVKSRKAVKKKKDAKVLKALTKNGTVM